jgi:ketosteroid isomerase-like protein
MAQHPIAVAIEKADTAIVQEDFETLMNIYSDDAILVVKPGMNAIGKVQIRKAFAGSPSWDENSGVRQHSFGFG